MTVRCWALGPQGSTGGKFRMAQTVLTGDGGGFSGVGGSSGLSSGIDGPVPTGFGIDYSIAQGLRVENVQLHP